MNCTDMKTLIFEKAYKIILVGTYIRVFYVYCT